MAVDPELFSKISRADWNEAVEDVAAAPDAAEMEEWVRDMMAHKGRKIDRIEDWLKKHFRKYPNERMAKMVEYPLLVALLKHSGLWKEARDAVAAIAAGAKASSVQPSTAMNLLMDTIRIVRRALKTSHMTSKLHEQDSKKYVVLSTAFRRVVGVSVVQVLVCAGRAASPRSLTPRVSPVVCVQ